VTFSYSGDPADSQLDAVRYLIGDTNANEPLVTDEEISFMIVQWYPLYGTLEWVSAEILDTLAARYAREANYSADGVSVSLAAVQQQLATQAASLRAQHDRLFVGAEVDVGGVDLYEHADAESLGIRPFCFGTGFMDNFYAGKQDYGGREYRDGMYTPEYDPGV
jgi:hypothetical protein